MSSTNKRILHRTEDLPLVLATILPASMDTLNTSTQRQQRLSPISNPSAFLKKKPL